MTGGSIGVMIDTSTAVKKHILLNHKNKVIVSNKEYDCLKYLSQGMKAKEISVKLKIQPSTIYRYVDILKDRFEVCSTKNLIEIFKKNCYSSFL